MGFTGRPSLACALCKQRRKKCDRTRPSCKQCLSIGRHCPGIPDEIDLVFRNTFSSRGHNDTPSVSLQHAEKSAKTDCESVEEEVVAQHSLTAARSTIPQAMSVNWLSTATTYYLSLHCWNNLSTRRMNPWLDVEAKYFTAPGPDTVLYHAVAALAAMTMAREMRIPELVEIASRPYGKALRAISNALANSKESLKNDVAVSIYVLTCYELRHTDSNRRRRYQVHTEGLKKLLVLRGRQQLLDRESLRVFRALRAPIVYNYMIRSDILISTNDDMIWVNDNSGNATPVDDLMAIAALVANLRGMAAHTGTVEGNFKGGHLVHDASNTDRKLNQWLRKWHDHVNFDVMLTSESDGDCWHQRAHVFTDTSLAALMNHYYLLKVLVLDILQKHAQDLDGVGQESITQHAGSRQISDMIDHICYSVPFITGRISSKGSNSADIHEERWIYTSLTEATWILLPFVVVAQHNATSQRQKSWLRAQLIRLNHDFGLFDLGATLFDSGEKSKRS